VDGGAALIKVEINNKKKNNQILPLSLTMDFISQRKSQPNPVLKKDLHIYEYIIKSLKTKLYS
jgi:hypothetical protein